MIVEDVVAGFLDSATERELDPAVLALLRREGYKDIHLIHGVFEFGKDFIAKRAAGDSITQYAIQSKAGDIGLPAWRECKPQILDCVTSNIAHPSFDPDLPRQVVLLTTGRLTGAAPVEAQSLNTWLMSRGERPFLVWDRDDLLPRLRNLLRDGPPRSREPAFLRLLGEAMAGEVLDGSLEHFSRAWLASSSESDLWADQFESSCICNGLRTAGRSDLAAFMACCLLRATVHASPQVDTDPRRAARLLFAYYADDVLQSLGDDFLDVKAVTSSINDVGAIITYPVRCMRILEVMGLRGWLALQQGETSLASEMAHRVVEIWKAHPGASHPISDRWAAGMIPSTLLVGRMLDQEDAIRQQLIRTAVWLCDRYDKGVGLANQYASPADEISYLVGAPFEHINISVRRQSYLATVLLDLAWALRLNDVFDDILNDMRAVGIAPTCVVVKSDRDFVDIKSRDARVIANIDYWEEGVPGEARAAHQLAKIEGEGMTSQGLWFDLFASWCVMRDRHAPSAMVSSLGVD